MKFCRYEIGDALDVMRDIPDQTFHCCVTSPPYWGLRDYGTDGQIGLESTPAEFVDRLVEVFREVRRTLRDDGTLWLNLGDSYANDGKWGGSSSGKHVKALHGDTGIGRRKQTTGLKPKDLVGIPWRVAFALQADGWYLRSDIIWAKPNSMPESVTDRPTKTHEYIFLMAKSERYYYDSGAIQERALQPRGDEKRTGQATDKARSKRDQDRVSNNNGSSTSILGSNQGSTWRNRRTVWHVPTRSYGGAHFATFPPDLIKPCILAGCPEGGVVLDPFFGSGTTGRVAEDLGRQWFGIELNPDYAKLIDQRVAQRGLFVQPEHRRTAT